MFSTSRIALRVGNIKPDQASDANDQRQAAAIFGGGPNAFSRYENGKTKPPLALVKLLIVLDRHPNLLNEVRAGR